MSTERRHQWRPRPGDCQLARSLDSQGPGLSFSARFLRATCVMGRRLFQPVGPSCCALVLCKAFVRARRTSKSFLPQFYPGGERKDNTNLCSTISSQPLAKCHKRDAQQNPGGEITKSDESEGRKVGEMCTECRERTDGCCEVHEGRVGWRVWVGKGRELFCC